ncbi:hypothetical protein [Saccharopolyspora hordei]|uniref:Uncharacterized protein n=1 Tax=Saccharopolyspora hordei TaxID=1838 RepID=A0A853AKW2_9PSEU|nr:hypothetical protein [Saccharopolyspora hordei]NYI83689.1 hypothetical protein [Saccharopolyspora hordei]
MGRSTSSMVNLLVKHWADKAEQVVYVFGNEERRGYVASTVQGVTRVPHLVATPGVQLAEKHRRSTTPLKVLRDGAFMGDEFVHDPGLWGVAQAATPNDLAVRFADNLSSAGNASFLAVTSHRVGVLVETAHLESEQPEPAPGVAPESKGFSLLGAAKSAVRSVASRGGDEPANPVTSAVEAPMSAIREIAPAAMGRSGKPVRFLRFWFTDGSALSVKHPKPGQLAETIRLNLR